MPVVGKSGTIKEPVVIFDEGAPNPYANFITELAEENGVIRVGFATVSKDGDGQTKAMIVVRLHLKKEIAWDLCRGLRRMEDMAKRRKR
ncbi:hypothetical protein [Sinorhizobium meliloti]|uniref:hypothetical protein n=1 Tax=Rhizobium meliloti TaxID=382 RepID=UPI000B498EC9|nr:hypothetical protein [Sinorhizobium meliloti]ASP50929.1 hypothetical protein CDO31_04660 [Sinorhizobium meliloti]RVG90394.1 hypothetical protein CN218_23675 [Sinorhizobium meliloti]